MEDLSILVAPCPFCGEGEAGVLVDLRAARRVTSAEVCLAPGAAAHPVARFAGPSEAPCPHLVDVYAEVEWARHAAAGDGPAGLSRVLFTHPAAAAAGISTWLGSQGTLGNPVRTVEDRREGVVPGRPATRTWRWSVAGTAVYAADPTRLGEARRPPRRPARRGRTGGG